MPRAVRYHEYGDLNVLRIDEVPRPEPGRGQFVLRVKATGINPGESVIRSGGKQIHIGLFKTDQEAHAAYLQAKRLLHEGNTL